MIALFNEQEFHNTKSREFLPLQCKECNKIFYRSKHSICHYKHPNRLEQGDFCCQTCNQRFQNPIIHIPCGECGTPVQTTQSRLTNSKSGKVFCNSSCAGKYSNHHRKHGYRVSQCEKWLSEQLIKKYPNLNILLNTKPIGYELDIFIPDINMAFEINGIFHYQPIYGEKCLSDQKRIDSYKKELCIDHNIDLINIDISDQQCFTPESSNIYLSKICEYIDEKTLAEGTGFEPAVV